MLLCMLDVECRTITLVIAPLSPYALIMFLGLGRMFRLVNTL